jgi:hypothetical protein
LELKMDDFDRFGLEMERECLITTMQAMVETVGSDGTIKLLRPYLENSGKAFALNLGEWTKDDDAILRLAKTMIMGQMPMGQECKSFYVLGGEAFFESEGCPFLGTIPEICECYCSIFAGSFTRQIDPDLEIESTPGNGTENPRCKWRFYHRTQTPMSDFSIRELDVEALMSQISGEEMEWRSHHYIGGVWEMITYAMVNGLGSEAMLGSLSGYMRRNGFSFGLRIKSYRGIEGRDLDSILSALEVFSKAICQKQVRPSSGPEELKVLVSACPFSSDYATPEHCQLIENINDGICKAINPDYEFHYDSMMTNGADGCQWTVRRRPPHQKGREIETRGQNAEESLLSVLKMRLAKGEISLEQYEKIAQVLK